MAMVPTGCALTPELTRPGVTAGYSALGTPHDNAADTCSDRLSLTWVLPFTGQVVCSWSRGRVLLIRNENVGVQE